MKYNRHLKYPNKVNVKTNCKRLEKIIGKG